jgi:hypothetical protein
MLMKIGMDVLDLVALFEGLVVVMGISTGGKCLVAFLPDEQAQQK